MKREIAKLGKHIPTTPNPSLFKMIRNYVEKYEELQRAEVYRIEGLNIENKEIAFIGMTKRKIEESFNTRTSL